jgi:uncharacterized protein YndB with AHSA1/START domain
MTTDKARKRATRDRMATTGERYAAARRHTAAKLPPRVEEPGMTDASIRTGSGKTWDEWFRILDDWGGADRSHRDIARWLRDERGVPGWWAQTVTVGYERARGMRARNETTRGFEVGVQKSVRAPADRITAAFTQPRQRNRWLEAGTLTARSSKPGRAAAAFDLSDGSRMTVYLEERASGSTAVQVVHTKLAGTEDVASRRAFWRARLQRLADLMGG